MVRRTGPGDIVAINPDGTSYESTVELVDGSRLQRIERHDGLTHRHGLNDLKSGAATQPQGHDHDRGCSKVWT